MKNKSTEHTKNKKIFNRFDQGFRGNKLTLSQRLHLDVPLLFGLILLSVIGLIVLYSASGQDIQLIVRQSIRLSMAFVVMLIMAQITPHLFFYWTPWLYLLGIVLLLAVLAAGDVGGGAQRWLQLGVVRFQPSEMLKILVPMMITYYFVDKTLPPRIIHIVGAVFLALIPAILVALEPDLGTAFLILCAGGFVIFLAGISWKLIFSISVLAATCTPLLWFFMHDYQHQRVLAFLNPEQDPFGTGYHIIQSKIAIGSGGLFGKGWLNGTQSQLNFLPERSTDFIFAVFSEEFGLLGIIILLILYLFVVFRGLYLALNTQELFGRLLGGSLILTFFVYIFVNIGMVIGLLPVVGAPLPLLSYGGTSLVTLLAAFGILMSMYTHRRLLSD
uniref:Peptidoglycan glycosyltransferase MrdB n=1 Tax=Candidatus Kentrum sp. TUN TaxID=2126343 RepID=A0A450ZJ90_9GAMM|nr:MAG: cell elongation-specific peptidoglycan biosynthesis regulator RodA [Candidatus Kentron sp. TUN]VFK55312.1 MAG: cell elongation-specific peptidoglycan biosynthesis regulator RodA [Candidatus Kentron sp. TUN]VFK60564.1 MAG: cell elongation-specific peptidoglycan biosynthesis regulator RodA [Candidatus Kentron sp. TUN]